MANKFKVAFVASGVTIKGTAEAESEGAVRAALAQAVVTAKKERKADPEDAE